MRLLGLHQPRGCPTAGPGHGPSPQFSPSDLESKSQDLNPNPPSLPSRGFAQRGSSSGIAATIEPRVLDDLGAAVSLLKTLARTRLPREDQKHAITADQLRTCTVCHRHGCAVMDVYGQQLRGQVDITTKLKYSHTVGAGLPCQGR